MSNQNNNSKINALIEKIKDFDSDKYYGKEYDYIMEKAELVINELSLIGEDSLEYLYPLMDKEDSWGPLISLEIIRRIKSEKSIPALIKLIQRFQDSKYFDCCDSALKILVDIGKPAVDPLIIALQEEFQNKIYGGYLDEALSHINDYKVGEFRLKILKDYIENTGRYKDWFNLELFFAGFREWNTEALENLKKLREFKLTRREKIELESAIECIEDPVSYKKRMDEDFKKMKPLFEALLGKEPSLSKIKIGRNEPCPCGSGKKYKKCCIDKE